MTHEPRILTDEPPPTVPPEVLRLRPESRRPLVLEGFVPVELADSGPRVLRPTDPLERSERATFEQAGDLMPPPLGDGTINWADRDSLFGD